MDTILSSIMAIVSARTRDNARTPMQWSAGRSAGFSAGEPWIKLGENHEAINAEEQLERGDSVFAFTRELLRLRREDPCLSEGRLFPCEDKPGVLAEIHRAQRLDRNCRRNGQDGTHRAEDPRQRAIIGTRNFG